MVNGILTVNLDPSYVGFSPIDPVSGKRGNYTWRYCTKEDIFALLNQLHIKIMSTECSECIIRIPTDLPATVLDSLGFGSICTAITRISPVNEHALRKIG